MVRYKHIDTSPRFLAVDLSRQLIPGTFEHALNHRLDSEINLSHFDARFKSDLVVPRPIRRRCSGESAQLLFVFSGGADGISPIRDRKVPCAARNPEPDEQRAGGVRTRPGSVESRIGPEDICGRRMHTPIRRRNRLAERRFANSSMSTLVHSAFALMKTRAPAIRTLRVLPRKFHVMSRGIQASGPWHRHRGTGRREAPCHIRGRFPHREECDTGDIPRRHK